ncbi:hypothetical protein G7Y79_00004g013090 [Physcia stellaris]|nr:hypothetical protein G7Y79_00004g013090 [Physcia stellaris]
MEVLPASSNDTEEPPKPIFTFGAPQTFAGFDPILKPLKTPEGTNLNSISVQQGVEGSTNKSPSPSISRCSTLASLSEASDSVEITVDRTRPPIFGMTTPLGPLVSKAVRASDGFQESDPKRVKASWDPDRPYHDSLLFAEGSNLISRAQNARLEEVRTTPVFSADVLRAAYDATVPALPSDTLRQYGLLAGIQEICGLDSVIPASNDSPNDEPKEIRKHSRLSELEDNRLFLNTNTPWSAFICGSQGAGKSHTLSCMLEAALLQPQAPNRLGKLPAPLAGIVFHYDRFTGLSGNQICEAAYLCSKGIPVKVLVSPASFKKMQKLYSNLRDVPKHLQPAVHPMLIEQKHLDAARMLKLMAVEGTDGTRPLYMEVVCRVLRQIAMASQGGDGFNFTKFQHRLQLEEFNPAQQAMLETRLELLKDFIQPDTDPQLLKKASIKPQFSKDKKGKEDERTWENNEHYKRQAAMILADSWSFKPGSLTIVDLSCPFVDEKTACDLFEMCLTIFLETRGDVGGIVALDEAHKFMNDAQSSSSSFTESLLSVIRQQRHLATRVIIATQEPTISPKLLDLSSMTIVHRFTSPSWLQALRSHLAGVSKFEGNDGRDIKEIFDKIVNLEAGEALLFSPSMMLNVTEGGLGDAKVLRTEKLGMGYLKMRVRNRLTADGGKSIMAA